MSLFFYIAIFILLFITAALCIFLFIIFAYYLKNRKARKENDNKMQVPPEDMQKPTVADTPFNSYFMSYVTFGTMAYANED